MFTLPELKINSFKQETIPSPSDLFARFGFSQKAGQMTGDDTPSAGQSKVEQAAEVEKLVISKEE